MDQQNIFFFGFFTITLAVSAFILWGPAPRTKKKKGQIVGLENLGSTCFLNTLLQALASCALFIQWLMEQNQEKQSLISSLSEILWVLNGEGKTETYAPIGVLSALKRHGWVVPSGEQDAHELFHVIVTTLQDETKSALRCGSLSDALPVTETLPNSYNSDSDNLNKDCAKTDQAGSSRSEPNISPSFFCKVEKEKTKLAQGDSGNPNSEEPSCGDSTLVGNEVQKLFSEKTLQLKSENLYSPGGEIEKEAIKNNCGDSEETKTLQSEFSKNEGDGSLESKRLLNVVTKNLQTFRKAISEKFQDYRGYFDRGTGKSLHIPHKDSPPFQGLLTSTLQCSVCGYYSSLHYDAFDSLSLPLGENFHVKVLKLQDLLKKFVKTEIIPEVECEKCCKKTTALKTMNFGKLPACLCLHLARTTWQSYSRAPTKRDDFVDFPEYLPMDDYTVSANLKKRGSVSSLHSVNSETELSQKKTYKHMYRLKSVVVHLGDVTSGHFVTYRRGPLNSVTRHRMGKLEGACADSRRWFMTSDDKVKVSSLCEAMGSLAYMLFYEKCSSDMPQSNDE